MFLFAFLANFCLASGLGWGEDGCFGLDDLLTGGEVGIMDSCGLLFSTDKTQSADLVLSDDDLELNSVGAAFAGVLP